MTFDDHRVRPLGAISRHWGAAWARRRRCDPAVPGGGKSGPAAMRKGHARLRSSLASVMPSAARATSVRLSLIFVSLASSPSVAARAHSVAHKGTGTKSAWPSSPLGGIGAVPPTSPRQPAPMPQYQEQKRSPAHPGFIFIWCPCHLKPEKGRRPSRRASDGVTVGKGHKGRCSASLDRRRQNRLRTDTPMLNAAAGASS